MVAVSAILASAWFAEQAFVRRAATYLDRAAHLPTYWRIFDTPVPSHTARIPPLPPDSWLEARLPAISADGPMNVLFLLLDRLGHRGR